MTRLVGLDVGTSSVKGLAIDQHGAVLAVAERGYPLATPRPGWAEQDPELWWQAASEVLDEIDGAAALAIGLSGQMHGLVALDDRDRPVRPAILWNDGRTQAQCDEIEERLGREKLVELTGNRALAGFTAPKLLWLREHEPGSYARIASWVLPKDYVRLKLCEQRCTDVTDASGTLLFDVAARRWSDEVVGALDLDPAWLPEVSESAETLCSTHGGVPVAAGAGDQAAGGLGVGAVEPGPASVALGTSGVVFSALEAYRADPQARVHVFCHAVPDRWHAMGVMLSAAGSLQWFRDTLAPGVEFGALLEEAARWEPGAEGLTFLPYLAG
jgi:xylulokinase